MKLCTLPGHCVGIHPTTQAHHFGADHIHANASPRQTGDFGGSGQPRCKNQLRQLGIAGDLTGRQQPQGFGFGADARQVQATAIIRKGHRHIVAFLRQGHSDLPFRRLAHSQTLIHWLDAVHHTVAQQVFERRCHAVQHTTIHFDRTANDIEPHLFARLFGRLAHHAVQPVGNALEFNHARAQQVTLQFARLACLGCQTVFGGIDCTLQIALHRGHVVDRLGHHAGELLHAGEAVELQWIESLVRVFGLRHARLHLAFGLQLDVAQLVAQAVEVVGQVGQRTAQLAQFSLHPGTGNHDLTRLIHQAIKQLGPDAHSG